MVLKSTSTRGNGGTKTDRTDAHPGIESSNELNGREKNSFFGFLEGILERVLKYSKDRAKEPEQDSEAKKREEFINSQYRMLSSIDNLDEVIAKRKEYGLSITPAAQDYLDFVQGVDGATDAWQLSHRAAYSLEDQIEAEDKGNDNILDAMYDEGKLSAFYDEEKNTKELYRDMTQEEYNTWRGKAADETREFMNKMDKKLADNPNYRPDTLNSVLEYRLYQVFKNSNIDNLRENLENQFYGELVGNNLVIPGGDMFPISTFANFQNGLITAGLLTPKDDFINKYEAGYDLYQENYKEYSEAMLEKRIISNIAQDKELLRAEDFDALIEKSNNDAFKKEMNVFKTLKENFNLSGRNREIYMDKLNNFIENYSTNFIYGIYGTTREKIDNPYSRRAIIGNFSESDYPKGAYSSLMKLVIFDRNNDLIEGLEKGTTTLEEFANKHGDEYKKLLNDAKESLKENFLALSKGFPTRVDYNNYLISNSHIEPEKVIEAIKEAGKKVIDVSPKFLDDVASGKHQELLKKLVDQIKEEYPDKKNVKKLLEEVLEKGAQQTITDKGLDGRTKEARFIKEVDKKIKEANELSM